MGKFSNIAFDIQEMFDAGKSNHEIAKTLGIPLLMVEEEVQRLTEEFGDMDNYIDYSDDYGSRMVGDDEDLYEP